MFAHPQKRDFPSTKRFPSFLLPAAVILLLTGCGGQNTQTQGTADRDEQLPVFSVAEEDGAVRVAEEGTQEETEMTDWAEKFTGIQLQKAYKPVMDHNPVMTQRFGADPYALVYDGRVYLYMTGDHLTYDASGALTDNNYGDIRTINVISSADLVNWTDHGSVYAASEQGAAKWGGNSWAPAAAYKNIDGKDRFFLYFANSGNGIAVLTADSPVGPFTDPIGKALISRQTPTCGEVTWLFDPAVLMDEDGSAYIYFGGGVPSPEKAADPGTARVAKLGADMISLDGDPVPIENVKYLFEDSGINRMGDTYYYSYCSNFSMTEEARKELGFSDGEIVIMKSDSPMGPFETVRGVLRNPGSFFGRGGNNHHCIFCFEGTWYIAYHARLLEEAMDLTGGYRSTNIDLLRFDAEGVPAASAGTKSGVEQVGHLDPFAVTPAVTMATGAGVDTRPYGEIAETCGSGDMALTGIGDGSWTCVIGADFGEGASSVTFEAVGEGRGAIRISQDTPTGKVLGIIPVEAPGKEAKKITGSLDESISGVHNLFFTFVGEGYELLSWQFAR